MSDKDDDFYCEEDDDFEVLYLCPTCKGTGTVDPLSAPPDFFCVGTTDCPHCYGLGRI